MSQEGGAREPQEAPRGLPRGLQVDANITQKQVEWRQLFCGPSSGPLGALLEFSRAPPESRLKPQGRPERVRRGPKGASKTAPNGFQGSPKASGLTPLAFGPSWGPFGALWNPTRKALEFCLRPRGSSERTPRGFKGTPQLAPRGLQDRPETSGATPHAFGISWGPFGALSERSRGPPGSPLKPQGRPERGPRGSRGASKTASSGFQKSPKASGVTPLAFGPSWGALVALLEPSRGASEFRLQPQGSSERTPGGFKGLPAGRAI